MQFRLSRATKHSSQTFCSSRITCISKNGATGDLLLEVDVENVQEIATRFGHLKENKEANDLENDPLECECSLVLKYNKEFVRCVDANTDSRVSVILTQLPVSLTEFHGNELLEHINYENPSGGGSFSLNYKEKTGMRLNNSARCLGKRDVQPGHFSFKVADSVILYTGMSSFSSLRLKFGTWVQRICALRLLCEV